jgi:hypothetical protein
VLSPPRFARLGSESGEYGVTTRIGERLKRVESRRAAIAAEVYSRLWEEWYALPEPEQRMQTLDYFYRAAHGDFSHSLLAPDSLATELDRWMAHYLAEPSSPPETAAERLGFLIWGDAMARVAGIRHAPDPDPLSPRRRRRLETLARAMPPPAQMVGPRYEAEFEEYGRLVLSERPEWVVCLEDRKVDDRTLGGLEADVS